MARMPGALWRPVPHSSNQISQHDVLCLHTAVGTLWGTDSYFQTSGGINSHFGVGHDGTIIQWVDTVFWSGANLNGNWHIISVETADMGTGFPAWNTNDGSQVPAWTDAQVEALAEIAKWANAVHGIPLTLIPDSKVGRRGVGYHRLGVDPYRVDGGEKWSNAYGKVCPGSRRIAQIPEVIARASGAEEDIMATLAEMRAAIREEVGNALIAPSPGGIGGTDARTLQAMIGRLLDDSFAGKEHAAETRRMLGVLLGWRAPATDAEKAALAKLWGGTAPDVDEGAIAASVVELVRGPLVEAVKEANGSDALAEEILARMGDKLATPAA